jgi:hypothetical protein
MTEQIHAAFRVVKAKRHIAVIDEDNGVSVVSDIDYVVRTILSADLLAMKSGYTPKVIVRDAFGVWDVIDFDGSKEWWTLRGLAAESEQEALLAA